MKVNFKRIVAPINFEGATQTFDTAKTIGNAMMYNGSVLLDIGFEDLAREVYHSEGEVEIPHQYIPALKQVVKESNIIATVKRELIKQLDENRQAK